MSPARMGAAGAAIALIVGAGGHSTRTPALTASPATPAPVEHAAGSLEAAAVEGTLPLREAVAHLRRCGSAATAAATQDGCAAAVYVWSGRMPLSREGIAEVRQATERLGIQLLVVDGSELETHAPAIPAPPEGNAASPLTPLPERIPGGMIAAGATLHYPSLLVYRSGRLAGTAILGYKRAAAYQSMIAARLRSEVLPTQPPAIAPPPLAADTLDLTVEYPVSRRPGAYFRSVAGRQTLAFEAASTIYLLDLVEGSTAVAPGSIDFVPTPDGQLFVTPGRARGGLEFYDAAEVFARAARGAGREVEPIHVDPELRDQYPSVGILETGRTWSASRTVYRVLTSWFDRIAFRDYEVRRDDARGRISVAPIGGRRFACPQLSIPILSPDGRYVAGRDEAAAATKIFRIGGRGECLEVADLGLQSGKVAWSPDGERLAFAVPRGAVRDGRGTLWRGRGGGDVAGIFVYDRSSREIRRVTGSEDANRLTFPEFVGADSLVYLVSPEGRRAPSVFRLVCCVRSPAPR